MKNKASILTALAIAAILGLLDAQAGPGSQSRPARADQPAWTPIGPDGGNLRDLAVNPANSSDLLAVFLSTPAQVFRTTNGGRSWRRIGLFDDTVLNVAYGSSGSGRLYAMSQSSLFLTRNGGASWTAVSTPQGFSSFDRLAAHPKDPDGLVILGQMSGATASIGVAVTTDGGSSWRSRRVSPEGYLVEGHALCVHPANPDYIYISGVYRNRTGSKVQVVVFRTTNGGASWQNVTGSLTTQVHELAADPNDPSKVYAATELTIYRSSDAGQTWMAAAGYAVGYGLAVDPANPATVYAGAQKTVFKSTDGGVYWTAISGDLAGNCRRMAVAGRAVFFGSDVGLFHSLDAGLSWTAAQDGIRACWIPSFYVSPSNPNVLYANVSGRGFYSSLTFGRTWTLLPYFYQCDGSGRIAGVDPRNPQTVYMLAPGEG